jgi:hypothetical protein
MGRRESRRIAGSKGQTAKPHCHVQAPSSSGPFSDSKPSASPNKLKDGDSSSLAGDQTSHKNVRKNRGQETQSSRKHRESRGNRDQLRGCGEIVRPRRCSRREKM